MDNEYIFTENMSLNTFISLFNEYLVYKRNYYEECKSKRKINYIKHNTLNMLNDLIKSKDYKLNYSELYEHYKEYNIKDFSLTVLLNFPKEYIKRVF